MIQLTGHELLATPVVCLLPCKGYKKFKLSNLTIQTGAFILRTQNAKGLYANSSSWRTFALNESHTFSKNVIKRVKPIPVKVIASTTQELEKEESEYLANGYGWRVRLVKNLKNELEKVADIKAKAFHEESPVFDKLLYAIFKAEILSGIHYNIRHALPNRYACLIAEADCQCTETELSEMQERKIVGVVEAVADTEGEVLCHLEGAQEYLYLHSMAVSPCYRRKKVATTLLKACDYLALLWGFDYVALQAYEEDMVAKKLYMNAGYKVASRNPSWAATLLGRKPRVLMIKKVRP
eukprot:TRINITY_DN2988_c0_g1_i1.p1 TRINITY_DN2988_c0_g1~~TRINITY_DN2988_c0_g1_i1.p1  ORF type:complete len:295 (+),score=43.59 TRINITY_DN2988_c0_g1_i1:507-1391(+)